MLNILSFLQTDGYSFNFYSDDTKNIGLFERKKFGTIVFDLCIKDKWQQVFTAVCGTQRKVRQLES